MHPSVSNSSSPLLTQEHVRLTFWQVHGLSVIVLLSILLMAGQSWWDSRQLDENTAERLDNAAGLLAASVEDHFKMVGNVLQQLDALAADQHAAPAEGAARLQLIRERVAAVLPGAEFAVVTAEGATLLASSPAIGNGLPFLPALLAQARAGGGTTVQATLNGAVTVVVKPHRGADGRMTAVLLAMVPNSSLRHSVAGLTLLPHSTISMIDAGRRPLDQYPDAGVALPVATPFPQGARVETPAPAWLQRSPLDGVERLTAERPVRLPWTAGGQHWVLQYAQATQEYRWPWRISAVFNLLISLLLLCVLASHIRTHRLRAGWRRQAEDVVHLLRLVLNSVPTPLALVDQERHTIDLGNAALLERFGALAGQGQAVSRLFSNDADWQALIGDGSADALTMLSRQGPFQAEAYCAALPAGSARAARYWLLSLNDVTLQRQRIAALQTAAMQDPLTGLANRRCFAEHSAAAVASAPQRGPLAVLALDLDHFKRVNDSHGHGAGDQVLVTVARLIRNAMRGNDLPARLGGEEFSVLLPDTDAAQARVVAERIRGAIAATPIVLDDGSVLTQTVSIGIALLEPGEADLGPAQERADAALYRAKEQGRNRCVTA